MGTGRSFHLTVLFWPPCVQHYHTQPPLAILVHTNGRFSSFSTSYNYSQTIPMSFYKPTSCICSFIYCKLNRMGSFFLMYTIYKCTMSIFLWCPTTICIRNGQ